MNTRCVLVLVCLQLSFHLGQAFPSYQSLLPNGNNGGGSKANALGHRGFGGGGGNTFGREFKFEASLNWENFCNQDSDGDGATNGEELGDPDCVWRQGDPNPPFVSDPTNPNNTPPPTTPDPTTSPTTPEPTASPTTPEPTASPTTPIPSSNPTTSPTQSPVVPADVVIVWEVPPQEDFEERYFANVGGSVIFELPGGTSNLIQYNDEESYENCLANNFVVLENELTDGFDLSISSAEPLYLSSNDSSGDSTLCELGLKVTVNTFNITNVVTIPSFDGTITYDPIDVDIGDVLQVVIGDGISLLEFPNETSFDTCDFAQALPIFNGTADGANSIQFRSSLAGPNETAYFGSPEECNNGAKFQLNIRAVITPVAQPVAQPSPSPTNEPGPPIDVTPENILFILAGISLAVGLGLGVMAKLGKSPGDRSMVEAKSV